MEKIYSSDGNILRVLSKEAPMKKSLYLCKVLANQLKWWCDKVEGFDASTMDILNELLQNLGMQEAEKTQEALEMLGRNMRFGHIFIPSDKKKEYHEDTKINISINNPAVKHSLFKTAMKRTGAFGPQQNMDLVRELMKQVFNTLGNEEICSSEHVFAQLYSKR